MKITYLETGRVREIYCSAIINDIAGQNIKVTKANGKLKSIPIDKFLEVNP